MEDTNKSIENLEEIINLINKELDKKDKNVSAILDLKDLLSLRNLIKAYKELEEKWYKDTHKLQNDLDLANADKINNYIPVSLVKEKIEEVNKEDENLMYKNNIIQVLQELLEKRK